MPEVRAIVFDSNVFGRDALPNVETIRLWAQACATNGAELWIAEIVAYELAQHVVEENERFVESYGAHQRSLARWGQRANPDLAAITAEDVVEAMKTAGAEIIELDGDEARDALLDQVLLRGAGARKKGIKTGGADSAWVRSIIAHNGDESDGLIVVTGDSAALELTCEALGVDVPRRAGHLGEISHLLEESGEASPDEHERVESWLHTEFVYDPALPQYAAPDLKEIGESYNWWELPLHADDYGEWEMQERTVGGISSVSLLGAVEHDRWSGSFSAPVELAAPVEELYAHQSSSGDYVQFEQVEYNVRIRGTVRLFDDGRSLASDEVLEDVVLLPVDEADLVISPV